MIKCSNIAGRMKLCIILIGVLFLYVIVVFYSVQIRRHDELLKKAKEKYVTVKKTAGKRGEIYDKNGFLLVGNMPCFDVCADPSIAGDQETCKKLAEYLAPILELDAEEIQKKLLWKTISYKNRDGKMVTVPRKYIVLKSKFDYESGRKLRDALAKQKCKAIFFRESIKRFYPKKQLLANVLGFTNSDRDKLIAVVGVEKFFNKQMKSDEGELVYERTRKGAPIAYGDSIEEKEVKDGLNIYLTIEEPIQSIMEEELDKLYNSPYKPESCYAVMADPRTGNILAIAQRPTFDPNDRSSVKPSAWRNRIAEDVFEPGSTMKPVAISGAIDRGVVTPKTSFFLEKGRWFYAGKILRDTHDYGNLSVEGIIKKSSNIGTAKIAMAMGESALEETLRDFGFGSRTGIPLENESRGIFHKKEKWSKLSISRIPIGQGISVTALQMVRAYCMLANGGYPVTLNLVDRIENPATGKVERTEIRRGRSIFRNPQTGLIVTDMMKQVAERGGTGTVAAIPGYHIAVKTGTPQKPMKGGYDRIHYVPNFAGFIPADNPRFVLIVVADSPDRKVGYYGGTVAGPVFKAIAERTLKYMSVPCDFDPEKKP